MTVLSGVFGVLPVPGRITLATGCFDTCTTKHKHRGELGILAYLSTHHYYLWSPMEKSVLLVLAGLGITYTQFIGIMLPYIVTLLVCTWYYIFFIMKTVDDVVVEFEYEYDLMKFVDVFVIISCIAVGCVSVLPLASVYSVALLYLVCRYRPTISQLVSYLDYKLLVFAAVVIALSYQLHKHVDTVHSMLGHLSTGYGAHVAVCASFIASFLLCLYFMW